MKIAMLRVSQALAQSGLSARMLLQVHDELVLECFPEDLPAAAALVQEVMENAYTLTIPLKTEARWGKNWDEMAPVGRDA
jgi:DNA polymerase-1